MILGLCSFVLYLIFWDEGFSCFHVVIFIFVRTIEDFKCYGHYYCCYNVTWRKSEEKSFNFFFLYPNLTLANWSLRQVWWRSCQGRYLSHIRLRFCFVSLSLSSALFSPHPSLNRILPPSVLRSRKENHLTCKSNVWISIFINWTELWRTLSVYFYSIRREVVVLVADVKEIVWNSSINHFPCYYVLTI